MTTGQRFTPSELSIAEGRTAPPLPLNEEQLLALMERHGIGTDATMAEHIKKVQERDYIFKNDERRFLPRPLGIALLEAYKVLGVPGIGMPNLRAAMERDCNEVAAGRLAKDEMIDRCTTEMKGIFQIVSQKVSLFVEVVSRRLSPLGMESESDGDDHGTDSDDDSGPDLGHGPGSGGGSGRRRSVRPKRKRQRRDNFRVVAKRFSTCGKCGEHMHLREHRQGQSHGRRGGKDISPLQYLFCTKCEEGHPLPARGNFEPFGHRCPMCDFQILNVVPGRGYAEHRHPYKLCPHCFNNVPPLRGLKGRHKQAVIDVEEVLAQGPIGADDEDDVTARADTTASALHPDNNVHSSGQEGDVVLSNFTCAQCAFSGCALAQNRGSSSTAAVCKCPYCCSGTMSLGKLKESYKVSCGRYPECKSTIWLQGLTDARVGPACEKCNSKQITMTFDATTAIIAMNYLDDFDTRKCTSCIRCNLRLWKELGIAKEQKSKQTHSRPVGRAVPAPAKRSRKDVIVLDGGLDNGDALPGNRAAARCYRCNQIGHYANACPENASGRGEEGRSSVCYNCNQPGHFANQCPQARQRGAGGGSGGGTFVNGGATNPMVCFVCQAPGHYASECPQRINRGARTNPAGDLTRRALPLSGTCFKCKQSGHFANQCPNA
mmetsp:Transcript_8527/g.32092  ORF Transcript_8527/g.32092 Transcript_8527/m.32092 type:complete len:659 (+) Transcript_8527:1132-3108(+)